MKNATISYTFEEVLDITPLALQKLLYYIVGIYMLSYNKPLFNEECQAWVHGPVYKPVYDLFKTFTYNPIDDKRFLLLKDRFKELINEEKIIADLVINTFGMYSGRVLEVITFQEEPWIDARKGYVYDQPSQEIIKKENIKTEEGINQYIQYQLHK